MTRKAIPKAVRESVLDEFNHRCAICGTEKPQVHHIDEDHSNGALENLLPLCPTCHLIDHHDPTRPVNRRKLALFRKYKDPLILSPEFAPLFKRFEFLLDVHNCASEVEKFGRQLSELCSFVGCLEMGRFYANRITDFFQARNTPIALSEMADAATLNRRRAADRSEFIQQAVKNAPLAVELLVELLRYQPWKFNSRPRRSSRANSS